MEINVIIQPTYVPAYLYAYRYKVHGTCNNAIVADCIVILAPLQ